MRDEPSHETTFADHHLRVERLLDAIRHDPSLDDARRGRRISEILAEANARVHGRRAARPPAEAVTPADPRVLTWRQHRSGLARTG